MKKVERFPSPPPVVHNKETDNIQSTPARVKDHDIKIEKFPTPSQTFRMQHDGDLKSSSRRSAAPRFLDDVENGTPNGMRNRVEIGALVCAWEGLGLIHSNQAKTLEQDLRQRSQLGGNQQPQIEEDPDMKIVAVRYSGYCNNGIPGGQD